MTERSALQVLQARYRGAIPAAAIRGLNDALHDGGGLPDRVHYHSHRP